MKYYVEVEGREFEIEVGLDGQVYVDGRSVDVDLGRIDGSNHYSLLVNNRSYETHVEAEERGECKVMVSGRPYRARLAAGNGSAPCGAGRNGGRGAVEISAPLPGLLIEICVTEGEVVEKGDVVAVLDSMKMNLELRAPWGGVIQEVCGTPRTEIAQGEVVARVSPARE